MKTITCALLLFFAIGRGQTAQFMKVEKAGQYQEYITKSGKSIKINDTIEIGIPRSGNRFSFIMQGEGNFCGGVIANTKNVVKKIVAAGRPKIGYKVWIFFKGYGLIPVMIDWEAAVMTGEVIE